MARIFYIIIDLKDYFLGVQVLRTSKAPFLSQQKYTRDMIYKFHLHIVKPIRTPLPPRTIFSLTDGDLLADRSKYSRP